MTAALLLGLAIAFAQLDDDSWRCVASEDGRDWECGQGDRAPDRRALPDSLQPLGSPPRSARPTTPAADTPARAENQTAGQEPVAERPSDPQSSALPPAQSAPESAPDERPVRAAGYALQLATVATAEAIADFAASFEVDLQHASRAPVIESGVRRQALLYGRFDSPAEARSAVDALPPLLQALRPGVVAIDDLAGPPIPLAAPTPGAASTQREALATATTASPEATDDSAEARAADPAAPSEPRSAAVAADRPPQRAAGSESPPSAASPATAQKEALPQPATEPPAARPAEAVPGHEAFADEQGRYTIQLANLGDLRAIAAFIGRHRLSGKPIYGLQQPDGRMLVVLGRYESLSAAEAALDALPPSLSTPWIRRADPLLR